MFRIRIAAIFVSATVFVALLGSRLCAGVAVPRRLVFGNDVVAIELSFAHKKVQLKSLVNRLTGVTIPLRGAHVALTLNDNRQIDCSTCNVIAVRDSALQPLAHRSRGRKLDIALKPQQVPLDIHIVYEVRDGEHWIEQYMQLAGSKGQTVTRVTHADWTVAGTVGPADRGRLDDGSLGFPDGCGQPVYLPDGFVGIIHPGAENFRTSTGLVCTIPAHFELEDNSPPVRTHSFVIGAAPRGGRRRAMVRFLYARRGRAAHMVFLVNDWYWHDKTQPLADLEALAKIVTEAGLPIDSFTLDDGWSTYTDAKAGLWGTLNGDRFPCRWSELVAAAQRGNMNVSLWFGPIGGYGYRSKRLPLARQLGFEINGDKLCLAGTRYHAYVGKTFAQWARRGMDYIKVDGFWPNCQRPDHGHPTGAAGAIAQMDSLRETFKTWRAARPDLLIGYTSGSNPSPFWLLYADYLWRGGADDAHRGTGTPFDRYTTFVDRCLQLRRHTEVPISAFVTFDIISRRVLPVDRSFERNVWWCAARGSLNHDWYLHPADLTIDQWRLLAKIANWAKQHTGQFQFVRMIGGDVRKGEIYGFAAFDGHAGTIALRNPGAANRSIQGTLARWLELTSAEMKLNFRVKHVFGCSQSLLGTHRSDTLLSVEIPAMEIAVVTVNAL